MFWRSAEQCAFSQRLWGCCFPAVFLSFGSIIATDPWPVENLQSSWILWVGSVRTQTSDVLFASSSIKEEPRSASPLCPKPNESEEPLGTAMETRTGQSRPFGSGGQGLGPHSVSARNINLLLPDGGVKSEEPSEVVITKEMEAEEQQLMKEGERKEEEMMKKVVGRTNHNIAMAQGSLPVDNASASGP